MARLFFAFVCGGVFAVFALAYYAASGNPTDPQSVEFFKSIADLRSSIHDLGATIAGNQRSN